MCVEYVLFQYLRLALSCYLQMIKLETAGPANIGTVMIAILVGQLYIEEYIYMYFKDGARFSLFCFLIGRRTESRVASLGVGVVVMYGCV